MGASEFMDNKKNDKYYADKISDDLSFIVNHMKGVSEIESFMITVV